MRLAVVGVIVLALAAVVALYTVASIDAMPSETTSTGSLINYEATTEFNYEASLRPNLLYNTSTLGPGQGTLFESLVTSLNLSFVYFLNLSAPADLTFGGGYELVVSAPPLWNYTLNFSVHDYPAQTGATSYTYAQSLDLSMAHLYSFVAELTNETGVSTGSYTVRFTAFSVANILYNGSRVESLTTPFLNLTFGSGVISPGPLVSNSGGGIPVTLETTNGSLTTDLDAAIVVLIAILALLGVAVYFSLRPNPSKPNIQADLKSLTAPYADAIATTWTAPRKENVVVVRDWEDIVHVADMLGKPILQYVFRRRDPPRYFYYVLDDTIQYIYLVPREGRPPEEDLKDLQ